MQRAKTSTLHGRQSRPSQQLHNKSDHALTMARVQVKGVCLHAHGLGGLTGIIKVACTHTTQPEGLEQEIVAEASQRLGKSIRGITLYAMPDEGPLDDVNPHDLMKINMADLGSAIQLYCREGDSTFQTHDHPFGCRQGAGSCARLRADGHGAASCRAGEAAGARLAFRLGRTRSSTCLVVAVLTATPSTGPRPAHQKDPPALVQARSVRNGGLHPHV